MVRAWRVVRGVLKVSLVLLVAATAGFTMFVFTSPTVAYSPVTTTPVSTASSASVLIELVRSDGTVGLCSGGVLDSHTVVTAGHCVLPTPGETSGAPIASIDVLVGARMDASGVVRVEHGVCRVDRWAADPEWDPAAAGWALNPSQAHDTAVLHTSTCDARNGVSSPGVISDDLLVGSGGWFFSPVVNARVDGVSLRMVAYDGIGQRTAHFAGQLQVHPTSVTVYSREDFHETRSMLALPTHGMVPVPFTTGVFTTDVLGAQGMSGGVITAQEDPSSGHSLRLLAQATMSNTMTSQLVGHTFDAGTVAFLRAAMRSPGSLPHTLP